MADGHVLVERTVPGLHDFLVTEVLPPYLRPGVRACDLGAGSGALALRLQSLGAHVVACDQIVPENPPTLFLKANLDQPDFASRLGPHTFDLVTAVEIIEHLESPINFLREVASLLAPSGVAILTTPNVDSIPARLKFAIHGTLRMFDAWGDPTHISPIFRHLLLEKYLPTVQLEPAQMLTYPPNGFIAGRRVYKTILRPAGPLLARFAAGGDCTVIALKPRGSRAPKAQPTPGQTPLHISPERS